MMEDPIEILSGKSTPNGRSIFMTNYSKLLWAGSECCASSIFYNSVTGNSYMTKAFCSNCRTDLFVCDLEKAMNSSYALELDYYIYSVEEWVSFWVGIPAERIRIDVSLDG